MLRRIGEAAWGSGGGVEEGSGKATVERLTRVSDGTCMMGLASEVGAGSVGDCALERLLLSAPELGILLKPLSDGEVEGAPVAAVTRTTRDVYSGSLNKMVDSSEQTALRLLNYSLSYIRELCSDT